MMRKQVPASGESDGHALALALAPHRDAILSQLVQTWRARAPKTTVMLGKTQHTLEAAEAIGTTWFAWLEDVNDQSLVREQAGQLVNQGLTYSCWRPS
jgi:hypothetical protein